MSDRDDVHGSGNGEMVARGVYDWTSTDPSRAVVETVANAADRGRDELDSLYEYVDPDVLDALVGSDGEGADGVVVSFEMDEYRVVVYADGRVIVRSRPAAE
ncbi:MAG: HalOD1 output domain-containing protein [Haloferacaceae archaeon]